MRTIAKIRTDYSEKFGIPRQSRMAMEAKGTIIFEPEFRQPDAIRGLEGFSHIWLLWEFSEAKKTHWSPTVRPPRLGGNTRMGVFATRSPFRPNPIGLSAVQLESIELHPHLGPILHVLGADLLDKTPIFDIKPYLPFADAIPNASSGFADSALDYHLEVSISDSLLTNIPSHLRASLLKSLELDPRPSYQDDPSRVYGMIFGGLNVHFTVKNKILEVISIDNANN